MSRRCRETFEEAFRQGVVGHRDDRLAIVRDWGFSVGDVVGPTQVMVARADTSIPTGHWRWMMTHLPDATLVAIDGNHFGPREVPEMQLVAWVGQGT
jgi:pimeloyl-ACP methyl ester carboxylesterase